MEYDFQSILRRNGQEINNGIIIGGNSTATNFIGSSGIQVFYGKWGCCGTEFFQLKKF